MVRKTPPIPRCVHHVALPCFDVAATHRFYADTLGLAPVEAHEGESEAWGGRFLHLGYALGDGTVLSFFALADGASGELRAAVPGAGALPRDIAHLALDLESGAEIVPWRKRIEEAGAEAWVESHEGGDSLYCVDPNGYVLELTAASPGRRARPAAVTELVERWSRPPSP